MAFCTACGNNVADDRFCTSCGTKNEKIDTSDLGTEKSETTNENSETLFEKPVLEVQKKQIEEKNQPSKQIQREKSLDKDDKPLNAKAEEKKSEPAKQNLRNSKKSKTNVYVIVLMLVIGGVVIYLSSHEKDSPELRQNEINDLSLGEGVLNIVGARNRILTESIKHIGIPYSFGSKDPSTGFDDSGFVSYVYKKSVNIDLPTESKEQFSKGGGMLVNYEQLKPGDLMFFSHNGKSIQHVGIFVGEDKFIHAPRTGRRISIDEIGGYWKQKFVKGKSYIQSNSTKIINYQNEKQINSSTTNDSGLADIEAHKNTFFVNAENGLNLRSSPSSNSVILLKLNNNDEVKITAETDIMLTVKDYDSSGNFLGNITDNWVKVKITKNQEISEGYVFKGYLSSTKMEVKKE